MTGRWSQPDPFLALSDAAAQDAVVAERRRLREQLDRAAEVATWVGALRDLAESRRPVTVLVAGGRSRRGMVTAIGADVLVVTVGSGDRLLVRLDTVRAVYVGSPVTGAADAAVPAPARGHRGPASTRRFLAVLAGELESDPEVSLWLDAVADPLRGRVLGVGEDVLSLRLGGGAGVVAQVPTRMVVEVLLAGAASATSADRPSG